MRHFIIASHRTFASGLKDTIIFLTNKERCIHDFSAYVHDNDLNFKMMDTLFESFNKEDEVIIMTDIVGGSVTQKFYPYMSDNVHMISGVNLPLALSLVLSNVNKMDEEYLLSLIQEAKEQIIYVNKLNLNGNDDE